MAFKLKKQKVKVDFNNSESYKQAEKKKAYLENHGYQFKSSKAVGYDKWEMEYIK